MNLLPQRVNVRERDLSTGGAEMFPIIKQCTQCGEWKSINDFHRNAGKKSNKDGRLPSCKACALSRAAKRRIENVEKEREDYRKWYADNKEKVQAKIHARYIANLEENREKKRTSARKSYKKDPLKFIKRQLQHKRNRRARIEGNGGKITDKQWNSLKEFYNFTCLCCGRKEPEIKLELDHVIPISLGGMHDIDNAQPLCKSCNSSKRAKHIDYRKNIK